MSDVMESFEFDNTTKGNIYTLYDKIINITFYTPERMERVVDKSGGYRYERVKPAYTLECPDIGVKPDIAIHLETLPDHVCYGVVVKIKNFNVPFDIRTVTSLDIEAGYRTSFGGGMSLTRTYHTPIFSSYRESPNPDGITVFEGVVVGSADDMYTNREIAINFHKKRVKLRDLLRECVIKGFKHEGKESVTVVTDGLDEDFLNSEIETDRKYYRAGNGYALVMWLSSTLDNYARNFYRLNNARERVYPYIGAVTSFTDNVVTFKTIGSSQKDNNWVYERSQDILDLDTVTSAEFNAKTLNVVAPWNPILTPDKYFSMSPTFFTGSNLPNIINIDDLKSIDNVYKVITMSVDFETNGPANEMKIFGTPFNMSTDLGVTKESEKQRVIDQSIADIAVVINFGTPKESIVSTGSSMDWFNAPIPQGSKGMFTYTVQPGDELNIIASLFYNNEDINNTKEEYRNYVTKVDYDVKYTDLTPGWDTEIVKRRGTERTPTIKGNSFWPLIALYTYKAMQEDLKKPKNQRVGYKINIHNPNKIEAGWRLLIPRIEGKNSSNGLGYYKESKDVFKKMALLMTEAYPDEYSVADGYPKVSGLAKLYIYLGGTSIG